MNLVPEFDDPDRLQLIGELEKRLPTRLVDREVWGLVWLSDLNCLRELLRYNKSLLLIIAGISNARISATWTSRTRDATQSTSKHAYPEPEEQSPTGAKRRKLSVDNEFAISSSPTAPDCNETAEEQCLDRDRKKCVITDVGEPVEVAHICPYSLSPYAQTDAQIIFWEALSAFWPSEQIDGWKNAVREPHGTEGCSNLICLGPSIHEYWGRSLFALKPIEVSGDKKTMKVQFCWLPTSQDRSNQPVTTRPSLQTASPDSPGNNIKVMNSTDEGKIQTGREIVFTTDDPDSRPLPSWDILTMQWNLQRLVALSGAAEYDHYNDNDGMVGDGAVISDYGSDWYGDTDDDENGDDDNGYSPFESAPAWGGLPVLQENRSPKTEPQESPAREMPLRFRNSGH